MVGTAQGHREAEVMIRIRPVVFGGHYELWIMGREVEGGLCWSTDFQYSKIER